ncbi:MAG: hypothetical protein JSV43_08785 [Methanobacteriota archaeon]|nr:MAG: hypothetical protein JSV43_08785 [Euryarchaeota archaeon]
MKKRKAIEEEKSDSQPVGRVFRLWVNDRNLFVTMFILSFVVWDSFLTYLGIAHLGIPEKNIFVSTILSLDSGWIIWLGLKTLIAFMGTLMFFLVYYTVKTSTLSKEKQDGLLLIEMCGWVYLVSFNLLSVFMWSGTLISRL